MKTTTPAFDPYTNSNSPDVQQWIRDHFSRMLVHSPYFDTKTRWYPTSMLYQDLYAIYNTPGAGNQYLVVTHPEWILRDAAGNPLYIPWGCDTAAHTCPQFAADFSNPDFREWWVDNARRALAGGTYVGIWIDDVNMEFRTGDGDGNFVNPIDSASGVPMTIDNWRRYMADFLEQIRRELPVIEILHNSLWFAGGDQRTGNFDVRRQIRAADYVYVEHGVNDTGLQGGYGQWSLYSLFRFVDQVNGMGGRVVLAGMGGDNPTDKSVEYAVAAYFLVSSGTNFIADKRVLTPDHTVAAVDVDLGAPQGPRYNWSGLYRRDFDGGMVLLNGPGADPITVTLPMSYQRAGGPLVASVTLGPTEGAVLLAVQ